MRSGVPDELRGAVWMTMTGAAAAYAANNAAYTDALAGAFGSDTAVPTRPAQPPHWYVSHWLARECRGNDADRRTGSAVTRRLSCCGFSSLTAYLRYIACCMPLTMRLPMHAIAHAWRRS